jgi:hypothetical protein
LQLALVESQLATNATDTDLAFRKAMIERKMQVRLKFSLVIASMWSRCGLSVCACESSLL